VIDKQEVLEFARLMNLLPQTVEKDYVLGWVLAGIENHSAIFPVWCFKGGTCLKKCYFETYRFSEDLDFTISAPEQLDNDFLIGAFSEIGQWIYENSGIEIPEDSIRFDIYQTANGKLAAQGKIGYIGPLRRRHSIPKLKLDLTTDELIVLEPVVTEVHHSYSDKPESGIHARCYPYEEVFAEKVRALAQRARPRDLYDVIFLFRNQHLVTEHALVISTLEEKCKYKEIKTPDFESIEKHAKRDELESEWENMLKHQLPSLPNVAHFLNELAAFFDWLYGVTPPPKELPSVEVVKSDHQTWMPERVVSAFTGSDFIEKIQFAAANRVCIHLVYKNKRRTIEPYSFRMSSEGAKLFYGYEKEAGHSKCYRLDRFGTVSVTNIPFTPRYRIEISSYGPVRIPPVSSIARKASSKSGAIYVYKCHRCERIFRRTKRNPKMRPHKDKAGYKCSGRRGDLEETIY